MIGVPVALTIAIFSDHHRCCGRILGKVAVKVGTLGSSSRSRRYGWSLSKVALANQRPLSALNFGDRRDRVILRMVVVEKRKTVVFQASGKRQNQCLLKKVVSRERKPVVHLKMSWDRSDG